MGFSAPKPPKPKPVEAPPTVDAASQAAADELERLKNRRGFASTLLTAGGASGLGGGGAPAGTKSLLGTG